MAAPNAAFERTSGAGSASRRRSVDDALASPIRPRDSAARARIAASPADAAASSVGASNARRSSSASSAGSASARDANARA